MTEIIANYGVQTGVSEYYFAGQSRVAKLTLDRRTGAITLHGKASHPEWAKLIEAMIEDRFSTPAYANSQPGTRSTSTE